MATEKAEDVELGMRLARRGRWIEIDPSIQVRRLRRWTLGSMIRTDLFRGAVGTVSISPMIGQTAYGLFSDLVDIARAV